MTAQIESLLADLTKEVRANTEAYIRLESTAGSELKGLREDYGELRELVSSLATTQANHGERITVGESRVFELQNVHRDLADLRANIRVIETQVAANAPVRTPWTAIVSAFVALGALLWTLFGR